VESGDDREGLELMQFWQRLFADCWPCEMASIVPAAAFRDRFR